MKQPKDKKALQIAVKNHSLTILFCIALVFFMLTFAIGLPIYGRFFYYIQIKTLDIEEETGFSYETIKDAYDAALDYCTRPSVKEFSAGDLPYSESGASHFADCKKLFMLNFGILVGSFGILLILLVLKKFKLFEFINYKGHRPMFYSAILAIALPLIIIVLILIVGFERAFDAFHAMFFPGKSNWIFNINTDPIVLIMPPEFFRNSAIIIAVGLIAFASALITADLLLLRRDKQRLAPPPTPVDK